jgi:hypothetical protein
MHAFMEVLQGNSLCSYLKLAKISFFSFTKLETRQNRSFLGRLAPMGEGEGGGERV